MATVNRMDLGPVSTYAIAKQYGYTGTEEEWIALIAAVAPNADTAEESAEAAVAANEAAQAAKSAALTAKTAAETAAARDVTAWLDEKAGTAQEIAVIDKSLSIEGAAADSQAVGDVLLHAVGIEIAEWEAGGMASATGIEYGPTGGKPIRSAFIPVVAGDVYTLTWAVEQAIAIYGFATNTTTSSGVNERIAYRGASYADQPFHYQIPEGVNYIRLQITETMDDEKPVLMHQEKSVMYSELLHGRENIDVLPMASYTPSGETFSVWTDMPNNSFYRGTPAAFQDSITPDLSGAADGTFIVEKMGNQVMIRCPIYHIFLNGQRRMSDNSQHWSDVAPLEYYIKSTNDTTDRTEEIQTVLNTFGACVLGAGVFYTTGILVPSNATFSGSGNRTRLILADSVASGYAVRLQTRSSVKDMTIAGAAVDAAQTFESVGTRHGILFEGTANIAPNDPQYYRSAVANCIIRNFNGGGITARNTGMSPAENLIIDSCFIYYCAAGINFERLTEFHRVTGVTAQDCLYGCIDNGGNNNFVNCDFSQNTVGLLIDNSSSQSPNNSHGTFSACTINHSGGNNGTAIRILGAESGEIFTGCQIFFGKIEIEDSVGIRFIGANIGRKCPIKVTGCRGVLFTDCSVYSNSESGLTENDNTNLRFIDCISRLTGQAYDPMTEEEQA